MAAFDNAAFDTTAFSTSAFDLDDASGPSSEPGVFDPIRTGSEIVRASINYVTRTLRSIVRTYGQ